MIKFFRFSPSRLALVYIALSVFVLALFAIPLWYAWRANISTFRAYVQGEDMQRLVDIFHREGAKGLATAMESQARSLPGDEIMVFADASKLRLAGNLPAWPAEVPDLPGTYGLVIGLGGRIDDAGSCFACKVTGRIPPLDGPRERPLRVACRTLLVRD